jgi:hypothetical protein
MNRGRDSTRGPHHHQSSRPFVWTKTADEILASVARFVRGLRSQDISYRGRLDHMSLRTLQVTPERFAR